MSGMSFSLPKAALDQLKGFITLCRANPAVLHKPELTFFTDYLLMMGATLPPKPTEEDMADEPQKETKQPSPPKEEEVEDMELSEESDVDLDMEGVMDSPDTDTPHEMGDKTKKEMTDEEMDKFDEKRSEAMMAFSEGEWDNAITVFTEAILLNPNSAAMFAKRGTCFIKMKKPRACIRDCTRAIELNPDNAAAYKFRGRAYRLLGKFTEAAKDLATACKIDFDEQADEWLKEVQPNAKKLAEHNRKKERKVAEKEIVERKERLKKAKEAREQAAKEQDDEGPDMEGMGGMGGGGMGGLGGLFNDPEMMAAFSDPEVMTAFKDISANPANIMKYQNNPKVMALVTKMAGKMGGGGGGGMGGLGGMAGMMGGLFGGMGGGGAPGGAGPAPPGASPTPPPSGPPKPPTSTDDLD